MQEDVNRARVWEHVLSKNKHSPVYKPVLETGACSQWPYLLETSVYKQVVRVESKQDSSPGHIRDTLRNVWLSPGSVSPC